MAKDWERIDGKETQRTRMGNSMMKEREPPYSVLIIENAQKSVAETVKNSYSDS